jgi:7-cyano-7-deazaguanine synthase
LVSTLIEAPVLLLLSGGIDSSTLLTFYRRRKARLICVHYQYGQPCQESELKAAEDVTHLSRDDLKVVEMGFPMSVRRNELLGRNAFFVLAAASLGFSPARIALGIHRGTGYYDCTEEFVNEMQRILDGYHSGTVRLEAPFLGFSKKDIINYGRKNGVPIALTYSCQRKNAPPCGECPPCNDRRELLGHL